MGELLDKLQVDEVISNDNGVFIHWSSDKGYGNYYLVKAKDGSFVGDSEYMDTNEDKSFLKRLLALWADKIFIN